MNCRPGDLAFVVNFPMAPNVVGTPVQLAKEPPYFIGSAPYWKLAEPVKALYAADCVDARGNLISAGQAHTLLALADECLRPIRDPGSDAIDEMVQKLGAAPKTLTEVREMTS